MCVKGHSRKYRNPTPIRGSGVRRDRDEKDAPIVSVSLGFAGRILVCGERRSVPVQRLHLESGDIWCGRSRAVRCHGVAPLNAR
jgi:hypothetical protein